MKLKDKVKKIRDSLEGDELQAFLHEENSLKREIDLCKNRLSIYFTFLLFFCGWIFAMIYQFVNIGLVDSTTLATNVSEGLVSKEMFFTIAISLVTVAGFIKDVFLLMVLKEEYLKFIRKEGAIL